MDWVFAIIGVIIGMAVMASFTVGTTLYVSKHPEKFMPYVVRMMRGKR
jgi:hypothetical protein